MKQEQALDRLRPLLLEADMPEEMHEEFIKSISGFVTVIVHVMQLNKEAAPNFITFATYTPNGQKYEMTVRACGGITPADKISELEDALAYREDVEWFKELPEEVGLFWFYGKKFPGEDPTWSLVKRAKIMNGFMTTMGGYILSDYKHDGQFCRVTLPDPPT